MENLYNPETGVREVSAFDFNRDGSFKLFRGEIGMIIFYAPWCGACKRIYDPVVSLAAQFKGKFVICAVNCEVPFNYNLRWTIGFDRFPSIYYFSPQGRLEEYEGDLDKDSLTLFITSRIQEHRSARKGKRTARTARSKVQ